ncbi:MAG: hypothetical protein Q9162_003617 [Coniocarpon cinnabarinum]
MSDGESIDTFPGRRKIRCSAGLQGCQRCRQEGFRCVYSSQKPMGRPKKRRIQDDEPISDDILSSFPSGSARNVFDVFAMPSADPAPTSHGDSVWAEGTNVAFDDTNLLAPNQTVPSGASPTIVAA